MDCAPVFPHSHVSISLAENVPAPTFITKLSTTDCDLSPQYRQVVFSLSNSQGLISVHPVLGTVTALKALDFEISQELYTFEVTARSSSNFLLSSTVVLNLTILDVNEHSPRFLNAPYAVTLPEDAQVGSTILYCSSHR